MCVRIWHSEILRPFKGGVETTGWYYLTTGQKSGRIAYVTIEWRWGSLGSQAERATCSVADPSNLTWVMPA